METQLVGLGDKRLDVIFNTLVKRVSDFGSLIISRLSQGRWEEVKFGRFLCNDRFTFLDMIDSAVKLLAPICEGRHVLLIEDTSEISFGYQAFQQGLAPVGNGLEEGFYLHPVIAMDAEDNLCLGLAGLEVFKRAPRGPHRNKLAFEDKQSYRWLSAAQSAREHCGLAAGHTVITDREGDIYEALCGYVDNSLDFVVRCWHNRSLHDQRGIEGLWQLVDTWPIAGRYACSLPRTDKRSGHEGLLQVKYGEVALARPNSSMAKYLPPSLTVCVVEVREDPSTVVNNEQPIHWILLTSHRVDTFEMARKIILYYSKRWTIEQVFRVLKSQGLQLQNALQHSFESLSKLAVLGLIAAVRVLQLVSARNHPTAPMSMAFDERQIKVIEMLSPSLEGKTQIQKNPHPLRTLAFAAWVVARLGGWKGYSKSERPPGPITMWLGLQKLQTYVNAQALFAKNNDT